ncbi:MAG: IS66 family transposase, partial [Phycisphaerae bacterium]
MRSLRKKRSTPFIVPSEFEAGGYCLNQWESLNVFARDPAVRMANNLAEQEMKRIALGRKNFL